jgi:predicted Fe-Mo cluster-binding NifX family protein
LKSGTKIALGISVMETIAITNWNNIVSPLYDASCYLLIIRPDGSRRVVDVRRMSLFDKADLCSKEGVNIMICGAISSIGKAILQDKNIKVVSWICGAIDEVICAYMNKSNLTEMFAMPGCGRIVCNKKRQLRHLIGKCRQ